MSSEKLPDDEMEYLIKLAQIFYQEWRIDKQEQFHKAFEDFEEFCRRIDIRWVNF